MASKRRICLEPDGYDEWIWYIEELINEVWTVITKGYNKEIDSAIKRAKKHLNLNSLS